MDLAESLGRLEGGDMSVSPSESRESEESSLRTRGGRGVGAVIVKGIVEVSE